MSRNPKQEITRLLPDASDPLPPNVIEEVSTSLRTHVSGMYGSEPCWQAIAREMKSSKVINTGMFSGLTEFLRYLDSQGFTLDDLGTKLGGKGFAHIQRIIIQYAGQSSGSGPSGSGHPGFAPAQPTQQALFSREKDQIEASHQRKIRELSDQYEVKLQAERSHYLSIIDQQQVRITAIEREKIAQKEMYDERCSKYEADLADYTRSKRIAAKSASASVSSTSKTSTKSIVVQVLKEDDMVSLIDYTLCDTFWSEFRREMVLSTGTIKFCYYLGRKKLKFYANDSDYRNMVDLLSDLGASASAKNKKAMNITDLNQEFREAGRTEIAEQLDEFLEAALVDPRFKSYLVDVE